MPEGTVVKVYDDFSKGEYGRMDPRRAGAEPGRWTGRNMQINRRGILHPRPGIVDLEGVDMPAGFIGGCGWHSFAAGELGQDAIWFINSPDGTVHDLDVRSIGNTVRDYGGDSIPSGPYQRPWAKLDATSFSVVSLWGHRGYQLVHGNLSSIISPSVEDFGDVDDWPNATVPDATILHVVGDRLVAAGTGNDDVNTLYYSDAGILSWFTFQALSFILIGDGLEISGLDDFRDGLNISKRLGANHYLTGTLDSTARLERTTKAGAAGAAYASLSLGGDEIVYVAANRPYPSLWNGAAHLELDHLEFGNEEGLIPTEGRQNPAFNIVDMRLPKDFLIMRGDRAIPEARNRALMRYRGCDNTVVWGDGEGSVDIGSWGVRIPETGRIALLEDDPEDPLQIYMFDPDLDRPGIVGDDWALPGDVDATDALEAFFSLPEEWDKDGRELRVRSVFIDFVAWDLGIDDFDNTFTVTAVALDRYQGGAEVASSSQTWIEATSSASAEGAERRVLYNFGDQGVGGGYQLRFTNVKGVGFRSIVVKATALGARDAG